jgi:serine protease AprX
MAAPLVAGAVALMLEQEPLLNPGTVKARLMLSAHKPAVGNPLATGAGALDIAAVLAATGDVVDAPSPALIPDPATGRMGFENTAVLWGNAAFSLGALWSTSVVWSDGAAWDQPIVWSDALLWPDGLLWPDATLWPEALLWPDTVLWTEAVLWPDEDVGGGFADVGDAQQILVDDPS